MVYFLTVLGLLLFHGMVTYSLILKTLTGLPVEGIALIIGVDRLLDMVRKRRLGCNRVLSIEIKLVLDLWLGRSRPGETIARAGIDDPGRSLSEKSLREHLGFDIAVRIKALLVGRTSPKVVVLPAEICEIVVVGDAFLHPVNFSEFDRLVPRPHGTLRE